MDLTMRPLSIAIMVFALMLAGLIFFAVPKLMPRQVEIVAPPPPAAPVAAKEVLVAARNLPAGTIMKAGDLRWQRWPDDGLDPNFLIRDKGADVQKDAVGRVVLRGFGVGEPITAQRLVKPGDAGFLAAALTPGMHALSIRIDAVTGDAGFIFPGDKVDVILSERFQIHYDESEKASGMRPTHRQVSTVVLREIRVLAIDQDMKDLENKPKVGATATVEVNLTQAQKLALAAQMGTLSLALRSHAQPDDPEPMTPRLVQDTDVSAFLGKLSTQARQREEATHVYHGTVAGH